MKIVIIGASGFIGQALVAEAVEKKYHEYAISRNGYLAENDYVRQIAKIIRSPHVAERLFAVIAK